LFLNVAMIFPAAGEAVDQVFDQDGNVLRAFAQRRQAYGKTFRR